MTSGPDYNKNETDTVIEELTAYLDGELEQDAIERVENRLGSDPDYRAQMQSLQQTWDLLDRLPETPLKTSFTQATMKMVVGHEAKASSSVPSWVWPLRISIILSIPVFLFAGSYGMVRNWQTAPDRVLINNLSAVGHHPFYTTAKLDNDFVDGLMLYFGNSINLRGTEIPSSLDDGATAGGMKMLHGGADRQSVSSVPNSQKGRREFVESLSVGDKRQLQRQLESFLEMTPEEKTALQDFELDLKERNDLPERLLVMRRFYEWIREDTDERIEVVGMAAEPALRKIEELLDKTGQVELIASGLPDLSREDAEIFFTWYETACLNSEEAIRMRFEEAVIARYRELKRRRPKRLSDIAKDGYLPVLVDGLLKLDRSKFESAVLNQENLQLLQRLFSPTAEQLLAERPSRQQRRLILSWVEASNQAKLNINPMRLVEFRKTLSDVQREALRKMPAHESIKTLKQLYRDKSKTDDDAFEDELLDLLESERIEIQ
ncbi:MAG: hypothetical protein P8J27_16400 [Mariniblastus sp.]|nr:hypothetical protein [Mariniblastus sp.]